MFTWRVHRVHWNEPEAATSDQFYYIVGDDGVDDWILCAVLNSRITWLANELLGRRAGGQGMTRLQTKVYETEQWPVPDPRTFSDDEREQIRTAFLDLVDREKELDEPTVEATEDERDALDLAIIPTLGLDGEPEAILRELKQGVDAMVSMRDEEPVSVQRFSSSDHGEWTVQLTQLTFRASLKRTRARRLATLGSILGVGRNVSAPVPIYASTDMVKMHTL
jgi:hypothetical protein